MVICVVHSEIVFLYSIVDQWISMFQYLKKV